MNTELRLPSSRLPAFAVNPARDRHPGKEILAGAGKVQLFGRAPGPWTIAWREDDKAPRHRAKRSTWNKASAFFERKATELRNRATGVHQLGPIDSTTYLAALENIAPTGQCLVTATAEHARREQLLAANQITFDSLLEFWKVNRPRVPDPKPLPALVEDYLTRKETEFSTDHYTHRSRQLRKLSAWFTGPVHALQRVDVEIWLQSLGVGPITRKGYRDAAREFMRYAETMGYIASNHPLLSKVKSKDRHTSEIKILDPKQIADLLSSAPEALVPFLCLQAFAGLRHIEVKRLDWSAVHLDDERGPHIYISKGVAKQTSAKSGGDRVVPISKNLAAWLKPYARPRGPIVAIAQTSGALTKAKRLAGIPAGRNQTKNILRKTWISHRLGSTQNRAAVAEEAGNSPGVIRKYYGQPMPQAQGERLFQIWPESNEVLQLNFNLP